MTKINLEEQHLHRILARWGYNSHAHLYYLGDKEWFWDSGMEALIAYRTVGNRRIVLGDPLGPPEAMEQIIGEFIADCRKRKHIPAFYQTGASNLDIFRGYGFRHLKIGEEAHVNLPEFHLNGKAWLKLRNRLNKFERAGFSFAVHSPPYSESFLARLQTISEEWLGGRKEKSFSVGFFDHEYISRFPVALLVGPDGEYEAFASIAGDPPLFPASEEVPVCRQLTVDLMRYSKACPHGTMDVLFASLFKWAKEHHYDSCSLGMAPLANVSDLLIARWIYKFGNRWYNFKGLYDYKNKFAPEWKEVYLVYPPSSLSLTLALLMYMVHTPGTRNPAKRQPAAPSVS